MEADEVLTLFDSCWFNQEIFKKASKIPSSSISKENPYHKIKNYSSKPDISTQLLAIHTRSKSEQLMMSSKTSLNSQPFSPDSVLYTPHLEVPNQFEKGLMSKSLSELEFEEIKGFMDLGFVFSEEDMDSSLVEIIPGLQRLGKKKYEKISGEDLEKCSISRPYLSEAWEALERRKKMKNKKKNPLMNWKVPIPSNETDIKDSLKWWAHIVASTIAINIELEIS